MTDSSSISLDIEAIKHLLPHRYPLLLVDRVMSIEPGQQLVAYKNLTANEAFFNGHFPQKSIMPGVLQVEALAQAAGILILKSSANESDLAAGEKTEQDLFYFAGIDSARFKRIVVPGDRLMLSITVEKQRRELWKFKGQACVDDKVACEAEFMLIKG